MTAVLNPAHLLKVAGMAGNIEKRLFAEYHVYELIFSKMILETRKKLTDVNKKQASSDGSLEVYFVYKIIYIYINSKLVYIWQIKVVI